MKKLLIATPAYGGLITTEYFNSILSLGNSLIEGWAIEVKTLKNDALVQRARQYFTKYAMQYDFDKILFIDADIAFTGEDVKRLLYSEKKVIGGTYPIKKAPPELNFNPLLDQDLTGLPKVETLNGIRAYAIRFGDKDGVVKVRHVPTGFLCIEINVLRKLEHFVPSYEMKSGFGYDDISGAIPEFFPVRVKNGELESEDWSFCSLCSEHGVNIFLDTNVILKHVGNVTLSIS